MRSAFLHFGIRAATAGYGRMAAALRLLGDRVKFESDPSDVVWPVLRDYPYGPPSR